MRQDGDTPPWGHLCLRTQGGRGQWGHRDSLAPCPSSQVIVENNKVSRKLRQVPVSAVPKAGERVLGAEGQGGDNGGQRGWQVAVAVR